MRSCRLPYSYPSCATLLNGNETRCQRCLPRHAVRCRAELIAPIQTPCTNPGAHGDGRGTARHSVMGAEHGCKRGTLPFFSLGQ
ncbi:hypothetical protein L210DRAFT_3582612 [Boletus edulis BED1]|uniref:Uncharacterized protein n=1 Tax=Boletus edulis BED1 TaxID=1328754 RepID=A0AAD4BC01_BOLED|nr:hypothetical protein L210DRAFT_3582612 [Boletus edulis BED1]